MGYATENECIKQFVSSLRNHNAAIFAGAGLSKPSGFVDWKELMRSTALDLGLDVEMETDLVAIAQFHINERLGNRSVINQILIDNFVKDAKTNENHLLLANLPINTFWTTNYDSLVESSLRQAGKTPDVKIISENICVTVPKRDAIVYKMHGDISMPNLAVLSKDDYETYEITRAAFSLVLQADLMSKTFLFIGFSFEDPNLLYILNRIKNLIGPNNSRNHYCFIKNLPPSAPVEQKRKQELRICDLNRYGISAVLINEYSEITDILKKIDQAYKRSQVFISGSAEVFEDFGGKDKASNFISNLGYEIVSHGFKITTGMGKNVGQDLVSGVVEYMYSTKYRHIDEYIKLMPFPNVLYGDNSELTDEETVIKRKIRNHKYRQMLIEGSGVAIFIFGNKKNNKFDAPTPPEVMLSSGVNQEFLIALENGICPIPVGATGYQANELWREVMDNFDTYFNGDLYIKKQLAILGDKARSNKELIDAILKIMIRLNTY